MSRELSSCTSCGQTGCGSAFQAACKNPACLGCVFCTECFKELVKESCTGSAVKRQSEAVRVAVKKPLHAIAGSKCRQPGCGRNLMTTRKTVLASIPEAPSVPNGEPVVKVDEEPNDEDGTAAQEAEDDEKNASGQGAEAKVGSGAAPAPVPYIDWSKVQSKMYTESDIPVAKRPQVCGHMVGKGRDTLCFDCDKADGDGRPRSPGSKLPAGYRAHRKRGGLVGTITFPEPTAPTQDLPPAEELGDGWGDAISVGGEDDGADGVNVLPFAELNLGGGPQNVHQPDAAAPQAAFNPAAGGLPPQMAAPNEADDRMLALCLASAAAAPIMQLRHEFGGNSPHRELVIEWFSNFMSSAPQQL